MSTELDRSAALRGQMRAAGQLVGPDGAIELKPSPIAAIARRGFDLVAASLGLLVAAIPVLIAMLVIRLESPGSPIFRQVRVGLGGEEFEILKLRTMVSGAQNMGAGLAIEKNDARITKVGSFLRRTSIDELPQLVNVLIGQMSVIGPRPTVPTQVHKYDARQMERLLVKPGLTGWAQVQGRASLSWPERIEFDRWYVENRSLWLDLKIIFKTVAVVLGGKGVERDGAAWRD